MPDAEETRLRAAVRDWRRSSFAASYALTHAALSVASDNVAFLKLVEADARAREQYAAARIALKTYRTKKNSI